MLIVFLSFLLASLAVGIASKFGGTVERQGATAIGVLILVALAGQTFIGRTYASVDPVGLTQDCIAFVIFAFLGINSKRIWPLWAAAFQLLSLCAHFVRALDIPVRPVVYAWMKSGPTWAVLILLIIGTIAHHRRRCSRDRELSSPD